MFDRNIHKTILLQILKDIYTDPSLGPVLGFKGGTAAHFFYDLGRFSVDLDFDLLNEVKEDIVLQRAEKILRQFGTIKEKHKKRNTLFFLLSNDEKAPNIKVEINRRNFGSRYELKSYLSVSMLVMVKEDMFSHKQVAMLERTKTANRDIFDVRHFLKNRWPINKEMVEKRTKMDFKDYLNENILENPRKIVAEGRNGIARIKNIGKKSIREIALVLYELGYVEWLKPYRGDRKFLGLRAR